MGEGQPTGAGGTDTLSPTRAYDLEYKRDEAERQRLDANGASYHEIARVVWRGYWRAHDERQQVVYCPFCGGDKQSIEIQDGDEWVPGCTICDGDGGMTRREAGVALRYEWRGTRPREEVHADNQAVTVEVAPAETTAD